MSIADSALLLLIGRCWLLGGCPVIESGTTSSMLLRCGNCAAILDLNVSLSSDTPGAHLRGVVLATRPCECGTMTHAMVQFGGDSA